MSLLDFPPLEQDGRKYCLQELNGRLISGVREDVDIAAKTEMLAKYPKVDRVRLQCLQHSISRENVRKNVFSETYSNRFLQAADIWKKSGNSGLMEFLANVSETTRFGWPLASTTRALKCIRDNFSNIMRNSDEDFMTSISAVSPTLNWSSNWLRCIAFHPSGARLAVCQANDYIRVYHIRKESSGPVTLRHSRQRSVAHMAWRPFDHFVLAVCCQDAVLIWRIGAKNFSNRPSSQCLQVLEIPSSFHPSSQCIWDADLSSILLVASPSTNRILILDSASGEIDIVGGWFGSSVRRFWPSPNGLKLFVSYNSNSIKIYDRDIWIEEKWTNLNGRCIAAAWSPDSSAVLFGTDSEPKIRAIRFARITSITAQENQSNIRTSGTEVAVPVYDVSEITPETSDGQTGRSVGGCVRDMAISSDGQRLVASFQPAKSVVALFMVSWSPTILLTPCGFIRAPAFGAASIIEFVPHFASGSLLSIVWTAGYLQYIPLVYGRPSESESLSQKLVTTRPAVENSKSVAPSCVWNTYPSQSLEDSSSENQRKTLGYELYSISKV